LKQKQAKSDILQKHTILYA